MLHTVCLRFDRNRGQDWCSPNDRSAGHPVGRFAWDRRVTADPSANNAIFADTDEEMTLALCDATNNTAAMQLQINSVSNHTTSQCGNAPPLPIL